MVLTPSQMLPLGTLAPDFDLPDATDGRRRSLSGTDAKAYLVAFICSHCPFVKHIREGLAALGRDCEARGVAMFAINSNDIERYPNDGPEAMAAEARAHGYVFPYLLDETQSVARAYRAACTPDFYLFDGARRLVYRGQLDGSRPSNNVPVTGADLRAAIDATLAGQPAPEPQRPSIGCNIKWRPGHEPDYFG